MSYSQGAGQTADKKGLFGRKSAAVPEPELVPAPVAARPAGSGLQQEARSRDGRTEMDLLRDTKRSLAEADTIANSTMGQLNSQTEQLEKVEADAAVIDHNLEQSEYLIRGLKPLGWIRNLFRKEPPPTALPQAAGRQGYPESSSSGGKGAQRLMAEDDARRKDLKLGAQAGKSQGLRPDQQPSKNSEADKIYDDIDSMLDGLKEKSKVINRTLDTHNKMLPGIEQSIDRGKDRINKQQDEMKRIVGR